jgi:hypothetical protein
MAQSVFSYSDVIRLTARALSASSSAVSPINFKDYASSQISSFAGSSVHSEIKTQINQVAKVYTAISKGVNHALKKYLQSQENVVN